MFGKYIFKMKLMCFRFLRLDYDFPLCFSVLQRYYGNTQLRLPQNHHVEDEVINTSAVLSTSRHGCDSWYCLSLVLFAFYQKKRKLSFEHLTCIVLNNQLMKMTLRSCLNDCLHSSSFLCPSPFFETILSLYLSVATFSAGCII